MGSWDPRPTPEVNPDTEHFWKGCAEGEFRVQECNDCGLTYFYPRALCPDCFSEDTEWLTAEGTGEVYTYSTARTMDGWPEDTLPLVVAYVELKEGPRVMTNIVDCDPDDVEVGTEVEAVFYETDEEDVGIPAFTPV